MPPPWVDNLGVRLYSELVLPSWARESCRLGRCYGGIPIDRRHRRQIGERDSTNGGFRESDGVVHVGMNGTDAI